MMARAPSRLLLTAGLCLLAGCAQLTGTKSQPTGLAALLGDPGDGAATSGNSAAAALERGDQALTAGDQDRALVEYLVALRLDADNTEALFRIANLHVKQGKDDLAESGFRRIIALEPGHAYALTGLGMLLTRKRQYDQAEVQLLAARRHNPRIPATHNALGVLADIGRDHPRAKQHYLDALALSPDSASLHNNLGYSYYLAGNYKAAIGQFKEALKIDPQYAMAWRNLGLVYSRQGRYEEALAALNKVQDSAKSYNDVGYIAMVAGRLNEAQTFFDEALRQSPEYYPTASANAQRVRDMKSR